MSENQFTFELIEHAKHYQLKSLDKALLFDDKALVKVFNGYKLIKIVSVNEIKNLLSKS